MLRVLAILLMSCFALTVADQALGKKPVSRVVPRKTHTLYLPAAGYVSSPFGLRKIPGKRGTRMHWGIDIHAKHGTTVVAAGSGTVIHAGNRGGYGNMVDIDHGGGLVTRYAHLDHILVIRGDAVELGQKLGEVGQTGHATGPNLHFETRVNNGPVDPMPFLLTDVKVVKRAIIRTPFKLTPTIPYRPGVIIAR